MGRTTIAGALRLLALAVAAALPAAGHALCTSDDVPQPAALLERFINADCASCWTERAPQAPAGTLVLDWVLPGSKGDAAPLAAAALDESQERLYALRQAWPARTAAVSGRREGEPLPLRLAQGEAVNDYVGASIELKDGGREPWRVWLLLVESLPAGTEGSPVARNLVRNVFVPDWARPMSRRPGPMVETRAMQIHEGGKPERLRLVALVHDARGGIRAITQTDCR